MGLSPQLELAQEITEIAELPPTKRRLSLLREALSRAETLGARIDEHERSIVVSFFYIHGSVAVSIDVAKVRDVDVAPTLNDHGVSSEDVARLVNDGVLTREIDEAIAWDPELAV